MDWPLVKRNTHSPTNVNPCHVYDATSRLLLDDSSIVLYKYGVREKKAIKRKVRNFMALRNREFVEFDIVRLRQKMSFK